VLLVLKDAWSFQLHFSHFLASVSFLVNGVNNPTDCNCCPLSNGDGHDFYPVLAMKCLTVLPGFKKMG